MCKNEGEGCGVRSTSEKVNNTLQQIMKRTMDYMNQGKCCDGLICQKGSQRESNEPREPEEKGGSCVKGIFSIILVQIHSKKLYAYFVLLY